MKSDWYRTRQSGTYLVVPAGSSKAPASADARLTSLIDGCDERPFARGLDSHAIADVLKVFGIDDCLKLRGYCIVRSPVLLEDLDATGLFPRHDGDARESESR